MTLPILLHPPKTGGISLRTAIAESFDPAPSWATEKGHQLPEYYGATRSEPAAILVRNPYTRFVAMYNHTVTDQHVLTPTMFAVSLFNEAMASSLDNFYDSVKCHPCYFWHKQCTGPVDVIRFENYVADIKRVYGIDMHDHAHLNQRTGHRRTISDVAGFYNKKILNTVNFLWKDDFENYSYVKFHSLGQISAYCSEMETA